MITRVLCLTLTGLLLSATTSVQAAKAKPLELNLPDGFVGEEIYTVPNGDQGSWICLTVDDAGRLLASDQSGSIYRLTPPAAGSNAEARIEKIDLEVGMAHGVLYAFESLYVMVNGRSAEGPGLYRVRDTDGDDHFDSVKLLRGITPPGRPGGGHGPHAIVLGPEGKSLYLVCGNMAGVPVGGFDSSRVPQSWNEDQLLPRMSDGRGHAASIMAPGGWIARTDPEGKQLELVCSGFRNTYDAAFNRAGDLLAFDADMEYDVDTPWYRPTRVCHVVSGGEFGWRNGSGKWPACYPDSLPPVVEIGLGSPTGVLFGYQTNFPAPYREALFLCDWSYGRIYTAHLESSGATYKGKYDLFASRAPLPVVDIVANPQDGALYLVTGGRGLQSHVYRIRYAGASSGEERPVVGAIPPEREIRRKLEGYHREVGPKAVEAAWPHLGHTDRFVRFAARIALEHQPVELWQQRALSETDPQSLVTCALALARSADASVQGPLLTALGRLQWKQLDRELRLELLRAYGLCFIRLGTSEDAARRQLAGALLPHYPAGDAELDRELSRLLAYLQADGVIGKTLALLEETKLQDQQMHYAAVLRTVKQGWTISQRRRYFAWFLKARSYTGGQSIQGFVANIRADAEATLDDDEKQALAGLFQKLAKPPEPLAPAVSRPFVKKWTVAELLKQSGSDWPSIQQAKHDAKRGRAMYVAAACIRCHRFAGEGGMVGPDLTGVARRFSVRDTLEAVVDPSKTIPHQFQASVILTTNGKVVVGEIVNLSAKGMSVRTDALSPSALTIIKHDDVDEITPSKTSMMPEGLLETLSHEEIVELLAYLATGDKN